MKCPYAFATPYGVTGWSGVSSVCGTTVGSPKISLDDAWYTRTDGIDCADRLEQRGDADGGEFGRPHRLAPRRGDERRRREVVHLARAVLAQHACERVLVEDIGVQQLDTIANGREVLVRHLELRDDPDDVVAAVEQELREIRAVLPADSCHERLHWCRPRTYVHASLSPSERSETITAAYTSAPSTAAMTGESAIDNVPNASAAAAPTASASRARPSAAIASVRGESVAIRPSEMTSVAIPRAIGDAGEPPQRAHTEAERDEQRRSRERDSGTSVHRFSATKTSGNVTAKPTQASIHGARYTTRCPSWRPTPPAYALPSTTPTMRAADDREHAGREADDGEAHPRGVHDVLRRGDGVDPPARQRRRGDEADRERCRTDERRRGEVRVREARHAADAEMRCEAEREQVAALQRDGHGGALGEVPEPRADLEAGGRARRRAHGGAEARPSAR